MRPCRVGIETTNRIGNDDFTMNVLSILSRAVPNPSGIPALSPGLRGTSYPGLAANPLHNPERVAANPRRSIHAGRVSFVAQMFNLLYRGFSICGRHAGASALKIPTPCRRQFSDTAECNSALRLSPNGASFDSPGQSPGKPAPSAPALKGRHSFAAQRPGFCAALSGLETRARSNPGLRLGLSNDGLSGLATVASRAGGTNGGNPVGLGGARRSARVEG